MVATQESINSRFCSVFEVKLSFFLKGGHLPRSGSTEEIHSPHYVVNLSIQDSDSTPNFHWHGSFWNSSSFLALFKLQYCFTGTACVETLLLYSFVVLECSWSDDVFCQMTRTEQYDIWMSRKFQEMHFFCMQVQNKHCVVLWQCFQSIFLSLYTFIEPDTIRLDCALKFVLKT